MADQLSLTRLDWPAVLSARDEWERLRCHAPTATPFLTPEWLESWWRHLGPTDRSRSLVLGVVDGSRLSAVAPLYRSAIGTTGLVALRPPGLGVSDYLDLLLPSDADHRAACLAVWLDGLLVRPNGWDAIDLPNVPGESPTAQALAALARGRGLRCAVMPGYPRPAIELTGSWQGYLRSRPGRFRYNLRSRSKRLERLGDLRFRTAGGPRDVGPGLEQLTRLHARRWVGQHTATIFSSSARGRAFYSEACRRYAARGLLDLTLMELDGRAVAGSLSFVERGTWYYYLPAWEPELSAYAPSTLLLAHLIERVFDLGLGRFDFMLGDEPYKAQWADEQRQTVRIVIANRGPRGELAFRSLIAWHRLRQWARGSTLLQRARRYGLGRARAILPGLLDRTVDGRG